MNTPNDPLAEIRVTYFAECEDLLESLQDGLQAFEETLAGEDGACETGSDTETVNIMFRAVHSIKGGAGAFALDDLVVFAHSFESVLDALRSGRLRPDRNLLQVLLTAADMLSDLVAAARDGTSCEPEALSAAREALGQLIGDEGHSAAADAAPAADASDFAPVPLALDLGVAPGPGDLPDIAFEDLSGGGEKYFPTGGAQDDNAAPSASPPPAATLPGGAGDGPKGSAGGSLSPPAAEAGFRIAFTPDSALFASGNEPLYLLRLLAEMGNMTVRCRCETLPALKELDCARAYLGWDIFLETEEDEAAIREIFDFVEDLCTLSVAPLTVADMAELEGHGADRPPPPGPEEEADCRDGAPAGACRRAASAGTECDARVAAGPPRRTSGGRGGDGGGNDAKRPAAGVRPVARPTVRVDLERIDRLLNLVGELVINQAMLSQCIEKAGLAGNLECESGLKEFMQLTRDIQDSVMMIRAQPVKPLFQRMGRIVRESAAAAGKSVRLVTEGEGTEVDKTVIESLADPLTHMIRNAVDHGLETPEERLAAGKPAEGTITLVAGHRSGRVVITVSDDGAGIDRAHVRRIAAERGLVAEDAELSESEIDNLLFLPGFSTAGAVSDLSGRGVGMDVVRSVIQGLRGRIAIHSLPGAGTTFTISLPLTLAVLDGMVVRVAGQTVVVPLATITETLLPGPDDLHEVGPESTAVRLRGAFVKLYDLGAELGYRAPLASCVGKVLLLVTLEDESTAALVVDEVVDQRQVVIKGLQDSFGRVPGVAAATILGDGRIALILDPEDIVAHATRQRGARGPALPDRECTG